MSSKRERRRKLGLAKVDDVPSREHDASRGTPTYAFNQFKGNMLSSLLNDLITLENSGLDDSSCNSLRMSLGYFVNSTTNLPSGGMFTGALSPQVQKFEETYIKWNGVNGNDDKAIEKRRELLVKLRKIQQKITDKTRALQYELSNDLDVHILKSGYEAIGELISKSPPCLFANLAGFYNKFCKKGGLKFMQQDD